MGSVFPSDELRVSASQVKTYLLCPELFRHRYVVGTRPTHRSAEAVLGTCLHEALALHHEHLKEHGEKAPLASVVQRFDLQFAAATKGSVPILWPDAEAQDRMAEQAHELLKLYLETVRIHRVLAVEKPFKVSPQDLPPGFRFHEPLAGIIDLIEEDLDGTVVITDLKTAARKFDDNRLRWDLQMTLYKAAAAALGYPEAKLRFRVLVKTKTPRIDTHDIRRDDHQLAEAGQVVSGVLRAIDQSIFYPLRGWLCTTCEFRSECGGGQ